MPSRLEQGSLVTVLGGSGFVGRHTVRALARDGWRVRAAVRRPDLAGHLQPMGDVGQIHAVQANLRYPDSVRRAVEGADAVVNLVGILAESGAADLSRRARGRRARSCQGRPRGRRQNLRARLRDRRGSQSELPLCPHARPPARQQYSRNFPARSSCGRRWYSGRKTSSSTGSPPWPRFAPFLPLIGGGYTQVPARLRGRCRGGHRQRLCRPGKAWRRLRARRPGRRHASGSCSTACRNGRARRRPTCASLSARQARCAADATAAQLDAAADG